MFLLPGIAAGSACRPHVRPAPLPGCPCMAGEVGQPPGALAGLLGTLRT